MKNSLFNPNRIELPNNLVLIPQFWDKSYYAKLKESTGTSFKILLSEILLFDRYAVIVGFLGYPHILTLLEFIEEVREKNIYFLGTAGSLNRAFDRPMVLNPIEVFYWSAPDVFGGQGVLDMTPMESPGFKKVKGVTVDIIQRETPAWLREQQEKGIDFVEMELYPLRAYLGKPFHALVVASDLLEEGGIRVFPDKQLLSREFVASYEFIVRHINEKKSHSN